MRSQFTVYVIKLQHERSAVNLPEGISNVEKIDTYSNAATSQKVTILLGQYFICRD